MKGSSTRNIVSTVLGVITLLCVALLLIWDVFPTLFPSRAHDFLGALPLALIAITYLLYQWLCRVSAAEFLKAALLAVAFLLWAANQFWPTAPYATLCNDVAIALFVLDVFLVIVGWPAATSGHDALI
jgi:hypothetical protein